MADAFLKKTKNEKMKKMNEKKKTKKKTRKWVNVSFASLEHRMRLVPEAKGTGK